MSTEAGVSAEAAAEAFGLTPADRCSGADAGS
jgi:hypothetical protein